MKFFLDTADIESIKKFSKWGIVDGVTTNPSIIAKEGANLEERIKEIAALIEGPVSSEVLATDYEGMMKEAREYSKWADNIYVKLPMTDAGMQALHTCTQEGIKTNVTLIFSAGQALLAMKAGATVLSPFVGRLDDISEDGMDLVAEIMAINLNYGFDTEILVASVRHPQHIVDSAILGAHICTIPPAVAEKLIHHPLTDKGLEKFLADWEKVKDKQ